MELPQNKVLKLEFENNFKIIVKNFNSFKDLNDFIYKRLLNKNYSVQMTDKI
jgi:hypothetical protein